MGKIGNLNNRLQTSPVTGEAVNREEPAAKPRQPESQTEATPKPTQSVTVQIDVDDHAALMMRRVRGHGPIKEQIREAIRFYLDNQE